MVTISIGFMATSGVSASFGIWLREAREKRGLTALALAEKSGYSHVTIHNIEHGKKGVKRETVEALATALAGDNATENALLRLRNEALLAAGFAPESLEPERIVSDEEWELVQAFRGLDGPIKRNFKGFLLSAVEVTGDEPKDELVYGRGPIKGQKPLE